MMRQRRPGNLVSVKRKLTGGKSLIRNSFMSSGKRELSGPFRENTGTSRMRELSLCCLRRDSVSVRGQVRLRFRMAEFLSAGWFGERQRGRGSFPWHDSHGSYLRQVRVTSGACFSRRASLRLDCATVLTRLRSTSTAKPAKSETNDVPEADKAGHLVLAIRAKKCHYAF